MSHRSSVAAELALALDHKSIEAINELVIHHTESGDLVKAFQQAQTMVRSRPDSAQSHHALGYVLRYAGLLQEAADQCETAHLLEPEISWGSCASNFMDLGDYRPARVDLRD